MDRTVIYRYKVSLLSDLTGKGIAIAIEVWLTEMKKEINYEMNCSVLRRVSTSRKNNKHQRY